MPRSSARHPDPPLPAKARSYAEKRDFSRTPEPRGSEGAARDKPLFVVQKHDARRLHWDFRLEHDGVLWSWAVPKGPSMDPKDKRLAVHVEDHPVDYAAFEGTIPSGNYGAGTVELWDQGSWTPVTPDPAASLGKGELKFILEGARLHGRFVLVRLHAKPGEHAENWLLIKEKDEAVEPGADAAKLEQSPRAEQKKQPSKARGSAGLPDSQQPQLASLVTEPPTGENWISEIKFDGYRMLCRKRGAKVTLFTRNGLDWTDRVPSLAQAVAALPAETAMLDGELVALEGDGRSSFAALQEALSGQRTRSLCYFAFDLLHLDGTDLRPLPLRARKQALSNLLDHEPEAGVVRFSEHLTSETARVRSEACKAGLEGIVCKKLDAPYRAGRGTDWVKLKCENRDEFVIVGYTAPKGSRAGLGALQMARYEEGGRLRFAGGVGTGFSDQILRSLRQRLERIGGNRPRGLVNDKDAPRETIWVNPELVAEIRYAALTPDGMLRHATFLGLREDKPAREAVVVNAPRTTKAGAARDIGGVRLTHPDRLLWPDTDPSKGVTKAELATYWQQIGERGLASIASRPLAFVRCPDGIDGEHFFQKHKTRGMPASIGEAAFDEAPYLLVPRLDGLLAASQIAAIELHGWGSHVSDPGHADQLVFDLDPGEGTSFKDVIAAAHDVRRRLERHGLAAYPRTSGGKGLHVLAPIRTSLEWAAIRAWCRSFAEQMQREAPNAYVATTRKERRKGRILVDWLRNGLGSTAIASYSPRARPGATVATPLSWREVKDGLDPAQYNLRTIPRRLQKADPWREFDGDRTDFNPADFSPEE